jgi:hypothetical protein
MSVIKTLVGESNIGVRLEARIIKEDHNPFKIEYYVDGKYKQSEVFQGVSIHYVEDAAENWINGVKVLNG